MALEDLGMEMEAKTGQGKVTTSSKPWPSNILAWKWKQYGTGQSDHIKQAMALEDLGLEDLGFKTHSSCWSGPASRARLAVYRLDGSAAPEPRADRQPDHMPKHAKNKL